MKILVISYWFMQRTEMGAVRPRAIAKNLDKLGDEICVITSGDSISRGKFGINSELISIPQYSSISKICSLLRNPSSKAKSVGNIGNVKNKIYWKKQKIRIVLGQMLNIVESLAWLMRCKNIMDMYIYDRQYDLAICSCPPLGSLFVCNYLLRRQYVRHYICDFRDLLGSPEMPRFLINIYNLYLSKTVMSADIITVVSEGMKNSLVTRIRGKARNRDNIKVLYNGFEERNINYSRTTNYNDKLKLCYTGIFYKDKRDMSILFDAISCCIENGLMDKEKIELHYAGNMARTLYVQAEPYKLQKLIVNHGLISRNESMELQNSSDLLIVLSSNYRGEEGILTGKFFEYMGARKPIIAIIKGDLPDSELCKMMKELSLGICCEYVNYAASKNALIEYITMQYREKMNASNVVFRPNEIGIGKYNYDNSVKGLKKMIETICQY